MNANIKIWNDCMFNYGQQCSIMANGAQLWFEMPIAGLAV